MNRRVGVAALFLLAVVAGTAVGAAPAAPLPAPVAELAGLAGPDLPDLVPAPAYAVTVETDVLLPLIDRLGAEMVHGSDPDARARRALRFATKIGNRGHHSLDIVGVPRRTGDGKVVVDALQCVRFAGPLILETQRACAAYEPVGSLSYHATHGHFHLDGFAQYQLLRDKSGRPDTGPGGVVARTRKVGFCMADTDELDARREPLVETGGWYQECRYTAPSVPGTFRQGISPGWGDTYGPGLPDQHIVIERVPDGVYWIQITVNPPQWRHVVRIRESNLSNNTSYRRIRLFNRGARVEVLN